METSGILDGIKEKAQILFAQFFEMLQNDFLPWAIETQQRIETEHIPRLQDTFEGFQSEYLQPLLEQSKAAISHYTPPDIAVFFQEMPPEVKILLVIGMIFFAAVIATVTFSAWLLYKAVYWIFGLGSTSYSGSSVSADYESSWDDYDDGPGGKDESYNDWWHRASPRERDIADGKVNPFPWNLIFGEGDDD